MRDLKKEAFSLVLKKGTVITEYLSLVKKNSVYNIFVLFLFFYERKIEVSHKKHFLISGVLKLVSDLIKSDQSEHLKY